MENFEMLIERDVVILVLLHHATGYFHDLLGLLGIARLRSAERGHMHVRTHVHVMAFHGMHGVHAGVRVFLGRLRRHLRHVVSGHAHALHVLRRILLAKQSAPAGKVLPKEFS